MTLQTKDTTTCTVRSITASKNYPPTIRFSAVVQNYRTAIPEEFVIRDNDALVKCSIPSFVTDFVSVLSWTVQSTENKLEVSQETSGTGKKNIIDFLKLSSHDFTSGCIIIFNVYLK